MSRLPSPELARVEHPAIGIIVLSRLLQELGHDPDALLAAEGLPPAGAFRTVTTLDAARELGFIRRALAAAPVPHLGLKVGQRHHFGVFGMWGLAIISSSTMRGAVRVGLRHIDLVHTFLRWSFVEAPQHARLTAGEPYELGAARRFVIERDLAACATLLLDLLGHRGALVQVRLPFPQPDDLAPYRMAFGCELVFGAARAEMEIDPAALDAQPIQANPMAARLAEEQCRHLVAQMSCTGGATAALRRQLLAVPGRFPGLPEIARELHLSERSLRRRLAAENSSYRSVLAQVRETLARAYLRDTGLHLDEIAERVGYSDAANFSHAFRRWTGMTPGRFRAAARVGDERAVGDESGGA
jgi:AraC-like DNA-binding protein